MSAVTVAVKVDGMMATATLLPSGTAPVLVRSLVRAQLAAVDQLPLAAPTHVTDACWVIEPVPDAVQAGLMV